MQKNHLNNSSPEREITTWTPENYLRLTHLRDKNYAVVILNRPINLEEKFVVELWNSAQIRHTVDGGTDRWMEFSRKCTCEREIRNPDLITGDFDSINPETLQHMESLGCEVIRTPDQNETDFTKALRHLVPRLAAHGVQNVIALADTSGRVDQIMANINTLFKAHSFAPGIRIFILSRDSLSWLLAPEHHHIIDIPQRFLRQKLWCAIVPIGHKCVVTTKGLKWDMTDQTIQFGGLVSSSNTYSGTDTVHITSSDHILWCMGIKVE